MLLKKNALNLLFIVLIPLLPHLGYTPLFSYGIILLFAVWAVLKTQGETFESIGFRFKNFTLHSAVIGTLAALLTLGFMRLVFFPILEQFITFEQVDVPLYDFIKENRAQYLLMVAMGWIIGGFYEELVFHGFIYTKLEQLLSGPYHRVVSFVLTAIIFGGYHYQLGLADMINAAVVGMVYLSLFLYFKRNLWYAIICHGVYNSVVMTLLYMEIL